MFRRRSGQILLALGVILVIFGSWAGAQFRTATARRLFFRDPFGMAAGADGRIYVGVDRREVHAYEPSGQPVSAWTIDADAGRFRIDAATPDRILIARERPGELLAYAPDGRLLERRADENAFARFGDAHDRRVETAAGEVFELRASGLARTQPAPETLIVLSPRFPLSWLGSRPIQPLAAILFVGTFGLLTGVVLTAAPIEKR